MDLAKLLKSIKTAPTATNADRNEETAHRPDGAKPSLLSSPSSSFSTSSESGSDDDEGDVGRRTTSNPNRGPSGGSHAVRSGGIIGGAKASNALLNPRNAMRLYDATATAAEAERDHASKGGGGEEATAIALSAANGSSALHVHHAGELALMPGARRRVTGAGIIGSISKLGSVGSSSGGTNDTSTGGKGASTSSALRNKLFTGLGGSSSAANTAVGTNTNTNTKVMINNGQPTNASGAAAEGLAALFQRKRVDDASAKAALEAAKAKLEAARASSSLAGTKRPRGEDEAMLNGGEFDLVSSSPLNSNTTDNAMTVFNDDFVDLETIGIAHRGVTSNTASSSGVSAASTHAPLPVSGSAVTMVAPSSSHPSQTTSSVSASLAAATTVNPTAGGILPTATLAPVAPLPPPQMMVPSLLPPEGEDLSWDDF